MGLMVFGRRLLCVAGLCWVAACSGIPETQAAESTAAPLARLAEVRSGERARLPDAGFPTTLPIQLAASAAGLPPAPLGPSNRFAIPVAPHHVDLDLMRFESAFPDRRVSSSSQASADRTGVGAGDSGTSAASPGVAGGVELRLYTGTTPFEIEEMSYGDELEYGLDDMLLEVSWSVSTGPGRALFGSVGTTRAIDDSLAASLSGVGVDDVMTAVGFRFSF